MSRITRQAHTNAMASQTVALALCFTLLAASSQAGQVDMAAIMKWASADVVNYHIVGVYSGTPSLAGGEATADVTDRVVIDLAIKLAESTLIGTPVVQNTKSTLTNARDVSKGCAAPVLKGEYEHYDLLRVSGGLGGAIELHWRSTQPPMEIAQMCTGRTTWPGKITERPDQMSVPSPTLFAMPLPPDGALQVSADKKSLVVTDKGWTWTFTPSLPGTK